MRVLIIDDKAEDRRLMEDTVRSARPDAEVMSLDESADLSGINGGERHKRVHIVTFGEFAVFADGRPVDFRYSKAMELFALLVDRRGKSVDNGLIRRILWQESDGTSNHSSYISTLKKELLQVFAAKGITDILHLSGQEIALVTESVDCDYYDYLEDKEDSIRFDGSYMEQYSWAESTVGLLHSIAEYRSNYNK